MKKSVEKDKHICLQYAKQYIFKDSSNHEYISEEVREKTQVKQFLFLKRPWVFM